jgi:FKBP-type peptidyl-prolyl cis-trans isomerase FklB
MKKLSIMAVMAIAAASIVSCNNGTPKASLKSDVDSLSYAIGMAQTQGLKEYLVQGKGIDTSDMSDEEIKKANTGSNVYLESTVGMLDVIEDLTLNISI